jgi:hypothetical protein
MLGRNAQQKIKIQQDVDSDDQTALEELREYDIDELRVICNFSTKFKCHTTKLKTYEMSFIRIVVINL